MRMILFIHYSIRYKMYKINEQIKEHTQLRDHEH